MQATYRVMAMAVVCFSLTVGPDTAVSQNAGPVPAASLDEQAIYEAVLNSWLGPKHAVQLVNQRLGPPPSASAPEHIECTKGLRFVENPSDAAKEETLDSSIFHPSNIELVDDEIWRPTDPEQSIAQGRPVDSAVREGISRSLITFSQIAFSADGKDALVDFSLACGRLCGTGSTLQMHKSKGRWTIARRCAGYIS